MYLLSPDPSLHLPRAPSIDVITTYTYPSAENFSTTLNILQQRKDKKKGRENLSKNQENPAHKCKQIRYKTKRGSVPLQPRGPGPGEPLKEQSKNSQRQNKIKIP